MSLEEQPWKPWVLSPTCGIPARLPQVLGHPHIPAWSVWYWAFHPGAQDPPPESEIHLLFGFVPWWSATLSLLTVWAVARVQSVQGLTSVSLPKVEDPPYLQKSSLIIWEGPKLSKQVEFCFCLLLIIHLLSLSLPICKVGIMSFYRAAW